MVQADPETAALSDTQRLQMVLLCGQMACLHELNNALPRDQAKNLLLTQLGFAQADYEKHLSGIFGDRDSGGACDGMRALCTEGADQANPTGRLNTQQSVVGGARRAGEWTNGRTTNTQC